MFKVLFLKKNKIVLENNFQTHQEAEDFVFNEAREYPYKYQIYDTIKDDIIDEGELESNEDIVEGTMSALFPDEESMEGFDIDDYFGNN